MKFLGTGLLSGAIPAFVLTTIQSVAVAMTAAAQRITISDAGVSPSSIIHLSVTRPNYVSGGTVPDLLYTATIVSRSAGSFDVLIGRQVLGDAWGSAAPSYAETVQLVYSY